MAMSIMIRFTHLNFVACWYDYIRRHIQDSHIHWHREEDEKKNHNVNVSAEQFSDQHDNAYFVLSLRYLDYDSRLHLCVNKSIVR